MTVPTSAELTLLNTHPQRTQLYLSVYQPQTSLACQVNGSYDTDNQSVGYDNVSTGSYTNITDYEFQVALIGSAPGEDDYGRTWVRSATSDTLRFVESDHINWQDDLYATVLRYTEPIAVYPRIIQNPADEEDVIFYKIWDIAYSDQNTLLGTFICMGSHYAGFMEGGTGTAYFSASGTANLRDDALTYAWVFEGSLCTGSSAHTPGNISWNQSGHHRVTLEVTSDSGRVDRSIRYVSWYDRPGQGDFPPITNWQLINLSGSRDSIGYRGRIRIREAIPDLIDGALVVIFKDDWYGSTQQHISKNDKGREHILFVGYIRAGTIQYNYRDAYIEFDVLSVSGIMEATECFGVSVESSPTPSTWYEVYNLNVATAIYHYLAWHSSVLLCADVEARNLDDRPLQFYDADRTSLYDAVNSIAESALYGRVLSDSLGKLWIERDYSALVSGTTSLPVTLSISKRDWIETPVFEEQIYPEMSFLELGGIAYNGASDQAVPYLSAAPSESPQYHGKVERIEGLALDSQEELNLLAGSIFANRNARYPQVEMRLRGNYANLDIAPQEIIHLSVAATDTPRGIVFVNKAFALRDVDWLWDNRLQAMIPSISLAEIVPGRAGEMLEIPAQPPDEGGGGGGKGVGGTEEQPPPYQPPPQPPPLVNVYENGVFKMQTRNLNFIGGDVLASAGPNRGDIYIDGRCDCTGSYSSGSFSPPGLNCDATAPRESWVVCKSYPITIGDVVFPDLNGTINLPGNNTANPNYTGTAYDECALIGMDADHLFVSKKYTGMFVVYIPEFIVTCAIAPMGATIDINYTFTLFMVTDSGVSFDLNIAQGSYAGTAAGLQITTPKYFTENPMDTPFLSNPFYLAVGDGVRLKIRVEITDNIGNFVSSWNDGVNPFWQIALGAENFPTIDNIIISLVST